MDRLVHSINVLAFYEKRSDLTISNPSPLKAHPSRVQRTFLEEKLTQPFFCFMPNIGPENNDSGFS